MIYNLFIMPFYNHYFKQYQNVISIDTLPSGPLNQYIYKYHLNSLSPVIPRDPFKCFYILSRSDHSIKSMNFFYSPDDIPHIIELLKQFNYTIIDSPIFDFPFSSTHKKHFVLSFKKGEQSSP